VSTTSTAVASRLVPPHGIDQIVSTFGNIFTYIREDRTLDPRVGDGVSRKHTFTIRVGALMG
jgi:hypothetical protein